MYGAAVDGDRSVECTNCGYILIGNGDPIHIECFDCFAKTRKNGLNTGVSVVCSDCALHYEYGRPVTKHSHPDGFTCAECGEVCT